MTRGKAWEIVSPYVAGIASACLYIWAWSPWHPVTNEFRDVLSAVATGAGSVFGFLLAGASLLVVIKGSWYKARAKEAGVYYSLVRQLFVAMRWALIAMIASIASLAFGIEWWKAQSHRYFLGGWVFLVITGLGILTRALRIFTKLFLLIAEE